MALLLKRLRNIKQNSIISASNRQRHHSLYSYSTSSSKSRSSRDYLGLAFFSSLCLGTAALGMWQTKRYFWKVDLIEAGKNKAENDMVSIQNIFNQDQLAELAKHSVGRRVILKGTFDYSNELLLGMRSAPLSISGGPAQGLAANPQGYYVITPLKRSDGTIVFVNRGWIPRGQEKWHCPTGEVELEVIISAPEKGKYFSPQNTMLAQRQLLWMEAHALAAVAQKIASPDSVPVTVDNVVVMETFISEQKGEQPIAGQSPLGNPLSGTYNNQRSIEYPYAKLRSELSESGVTPMTHAVYALTWFSLSMAGTIMTYSKFRGRGVRRRRNR